MFVLYFRPTTTITKPTTDVLPPQPIANQKSYFFLNIFLWIHLNIFWWVDFLWLHNKWFSQSKPSFEKSKFLNGCLRATNPILVCFLVIKWTRHLDSFDILIWKSRFTLLLEWLYMKRTSLRRSLQQKVHRNWWWWFTPNVMFRNKTHISCSIVFIFVAHMVLLHLQLLFAWTFGNIIHYI